MVVAPADTPVTTPDALTAATAVLVLLQVPPVPVPESDIADDPQIEVAPEIVPAAGAGLTVIALKATTVPQPLVMVYLIVSAPAETPVTTPEALTVATAGVTLLQVPPVVPEALARAIVAEGQTTARPVMVPATGNGLTVIIADATAVPQLLVTVYLMVSVPPATPVTPPKEEMLATLSVELLQVPPAAVSARAIEADWQTVEGPVMPPAKGCGLTVNGYTATAVPHPLVTVYLIVSDPADIPVTTPADEIVSTAGVSVLQLPPEAVSASVAGKPAHTVVAPVMEPANGNGLTPTIAVWPVIAAS